MAALHVLSLLIKGRPVCASSLCARKVIIHNCQSPGDVTVLTGALKALHDAFPGRFVTDVRTPCPALWEANPFVTHLPDGGAEHVRPTYEGIRSSDSRPIHFVQALCDDLARALGLPPFSPSNWLIPSIVLSPHERSLKGPVEEVTGRTGPYWIVNAGIKRDYTAKRWNGYQAVINATRRNVVWAQVGSSEHVHEPLDGVVDLLGKTDLREFVRLVYHSSGVLCGVTALAHLAHWVERGPFNPLRRHAVVIAGGREPPHWFSYPGHHVLNTIGELDCCAGGACWRSRVVPLGDGSEHDESLCKHPRDKEVGLCMERIIPESVSTLILRIMSTA